MKEPDIKLKCIVADDEPVIRKRIAEMASAEGLVVAAMAADGDEALLLIENAEPDIVFLDIRMPGLSGLELANAIAEFETTPVVIFVTAFGEHAAAAFELAAIDYVIKPVESDRFSEAVRRAKETVLGRAARNTLERLQSVLRQGRPERLALRSGSTVISASPRDIVRFVAADDYVEACLGSSTHLLSVTLEAVERLLEAPPFLRVHRSHLVNVDHIAQISREAGRSTLMMADGCRVPVARSHDDALRRILEGL